MRSREALEAADSSGEAWLRGGPLLVLGHVATWKGDHDGAQPFYSEAIEVLRRAGDTWALGIVLAASASLAIARDSKHRRARKHPRHCVYVSNSKIRAASPGASTCSPVSSQRHGSGLRGHPVVGSGRGATGKRRRFAQPVDQVDPGTLY